MSLNLIGGCLAYSPAVYTTDDRLALSCWVKIPTGYTMVDGGRYVMMGVDGDFWIANKGFGIDSMSSNFYFQLGQTAATTIHSPIPRDTWVHLGLMNDRQGGVGGITKMYYNGAYVGTVAGLRNTSTGGRLSLGNYAAGDSGNSAGQRSDLMAAELAGWSGTTLTDQEFFQLGRGYTPSSVHPTGLSGYWPLSSAYGLTDPRYGYGVINTWNAPSIVSDHPTVKSLSAYATRILSNPDLTAYYQMEDPSGATLHDWKGSADGTIVGSASNLLFQQAGSPTVVYYVKWPSGVANGNYFNVPKNVQDDLTIEFWFWCSDNPTGTSYGFGYALVDARYTGYVWDVGLSLTNANGSGTISGGVTNGSMSWWGVNSQPGFNDGQWHHVAMTRVKSSGVITLYVDGAFQNSVTAHNSSLTSTAPFGIGGNDANGLQFKNGGIAHVAIYGAALSQAVIVDHYYSGPASSQGCFNVSPGALVHFAQPSSLIRRVSGAYGIHLTAKRPSRVIDPMVSGTGSRKRRRRKLNTGLD